MPGAGFPFLGFTHYWGFLRGGKSIVKRKTVSDRLVGHCGQCPRGVSATGTRSCGNTEQPFGASYWVTMDILRHHRQWAFAGVPPPRGEVPMVEVAEPAVVVAASTAYALPGCYCGTRCRWLVLSIPSTIDAAKHAT